MDKQKRKPLCDRAAAVTAAATGLAGCWNILRAIHLGSLPLFTAELVLNVLFFLVAVSAWKGRMPWLLLVPAVAGGCLMYTMNYASYELQQPGLLIQTVAAGLSAIGGTCDVIRNKRPIRRVPWAALGLALMIVAVFAGSWAVKTQQASSSPASARLRI